MIHCRLLLAAMLITSTLRAQSDTLLSGTFSDTPLPQFLQEAKAKTGLPIFFDPQTLAGLSVSLTLDRQPLAAAFTRAFAGTDLRATRTPQGWIITRGLQLQASLPAGLSGREGTAQDNRAVTVFDRLERRQAATAGSAAETRLYEVGTRAAATGPTATLAGYVRNLYTGEPIPGATVVVDSAGNSVVTDQYGYYTLTLPTGAFRLQIGGTGFAPTQRLVLLRSDGRLDINMQERVTGLREVVVSAQRSSSVNSVQMGVERLSIRAIKRVPAVFGEADVLRVVLTLPGVKTVGEASTGFNVRGGSADQNLILFNESTIYNPSHFFGFFSAFNPDVVQDIQLYKSSIPARYGGRLSSVLEITAREGNKKELAGSAGIGLLTSRLHLEGPIQKDKTSFIVGGRTTYANWLLGLLPDEYSGSKASFSDVNLQLHHKAGARNEYFGTGYLSRDAFTLNRDTTFSYGNNNASIKWKHTLNSRLVAVQSAGIDQYRYGITGKGQPLTGYELQFGIRQLHARTEWTWHYNPDHTVGFGGNTIRYRLSPGDFRPFGDSSLVQARLMEAEQAQESAVHLSDRWTLSDKVALDLGLRYSFFQFLGPNQIASYRKGVPRTEDSRTGTTAFGKGDAIQTYHGPEYRASLRYQINGNTSIKAAYNTLRQYIHMLSNTTAISPTDIWKLSDPNIRPQQGTQYSLGFYRTLKGGALELNLEGYYKTIRDYLDFKSGATLVMNENVETEVMSTEGKAYGGELLLKKASGKLNGWLSYTYSRILLRMSDSTEGPRVNGGAWYPASYDKPHDVTLVGNYRFSHRVSFSLNATYSTGRPITLPVARFFYGNSQRVVYSDRNAYRIPDYFRTDVSLNIEGNHRVKQRTHNSWTIGVYNLTGRNNPYSVYFDAENGRINGYQLSIFGSMLPFVNYNIRF